MPFWSIWLASAGELFLGHDVRGVANLMAKWAFIDRGPRSPRISHDVTM
jgi:hypothetical protein